MAEHDLNKIVDDDGEVFNLRDNTKQPTADRVTSWSSTTSDTKYPSEKLVKDSLDAKQATLTFDGTYNASTNKAATVSTVTNAINGLDVSSVGGNGKYISAISETNGKISATATTMDTAPTASSTKAVTSGGIKTALDGKVPNFTCESQYFWDNTFCSGMMSGPGIVSIHDGFFCLDKRDYKITITKTINGVDTDLSAQASHLFNLYADDYSALRFGGGTLKIEIERQVAGTYVWANCGYPYGTYRIYNYAAMPAGCTMRVKTNYPSQIEPGWHALTVNSSTNGYQFWATNNYYNVEKLEIVLDATNLTTASTVAPVILVFVPFRPDTSKADSHPIVRKYGPEKLYFALTAPEFIGDLTGKLSTARKLAVSLSNTSTDTSFDGSADVTNIKTTGTLGVGNGGTGKTTAKAAEYNLTTGKSEISDTTSGDDRVVFELASPSESNGVTRGFRKLSTIWTWIKGLLSSESDVNISGSSTSCTGNAATASAAQSGSALETAINGKAPNAPSEVTIANGDKVIIADSSDSNKVKRASVAFDGSTTTKALSQKGTFETFLTSHQSITGKMNTSGDNAVAPSSSGTGATATLLNNLTGPNNLDPISGDDVLIPTTESTGYEQTKWYKRPVSKLWSYIKGKMTSDNGVDISGTAATAKAYDSSFTGTNSIYSALNGKSSTSHTHVADANDVTDNSEASSLNVITDTTEIVTTNTAGYTSSDKRLYRRPAGSKIWPWIKSKLGISSAVGSSTLPVYFDSNGQAKAITTYNGNASSADYLKYQIDNEINFKNVPSVSDGGPRTWFNYRNGDSGSADSSNKISDYLFGNRNNDVQGVRLHAEGIAFRSFYPQSNEAFFAKITMNSNGWGTIRFRVTGSAKSTSTGNDIFGSCDIVVKCRGDESNWHAFYTRSIRSNDSTTAFLQGIYYESGQTFYIGVRKSGFASRIHVEVIDCCTSSQSVSYESTSSYRGFTYEIGDFNSSVGTAANMMGGTAAYNPANVGTATGSSSTPVFVDAVGKIKACTSVNADTVDGFHISVGSYGTSANTIYFY